LIAKKISIKGVRKPPSMIHASPPQPMRGCHTGISWIHDTSSIQGRQARQIRGRQVDVTWIEGPTGTKTNSKSYTHRECTQGPTCQPPRQRGRPAGPTKGRPNRGFGRIALGPIDPGLPRGASLLAPKGIPRVFAASLCTEAGCPWPINRRGGGSFLTHTSLVHFSLF